MGFKISSISSSGAKVYFQIIFSLCFERVAKSFIFLSATRIAGDSSSSNKTFFSRSFSWASFSIVFKLSVFSSSFCVCEGRR